MLVFNRAHAKPKCVFTLPPFFMLIGTFVGWFVCTFASHRMTNNAIFPLAALLHTRFIDVVAVVVTLTVV
eukprot:m.14279 g.14279  ORF g.14279 m.14279 type:complete len:70 (-) comp6189_c0_seq1:57-266(-)